MVVSAYLQPTTEPALQMSHNHCFAFMGDFVSMPLESLTKTLVLPSHGIGSPGLWVIQFGGGGVMVLVLRCQLKVVSQCTVQVGHPSELCSANATSSATLWALRAVVCQRACQRSSGSLG